MKKMMGFVFCVLLIITLAKADEKAFTPWRLEDICPSDKPCQCVGCALCGVDVADCNSHSSCTESLTCENATVTPVGEPETAYIIPIGAVFFCEGGQKQLVVNAPEGSTWYACGTAAIPYSEPSTTTTLPPPTGLTVYAIQNTPKSIPIFSCPPTELNVSPQVVATVEGNTWYTCAAVLQNTKVIPVKKP